MDTWVQVEKLRDGDSVNSETLNTPIDQLASRTEYLKRRLGTIIEDGVQSALILSDVDLDKEDVDNLSVGMVVYKAKDGFRRAQAKMHLYDDFTADDSAFTIGIIINKSSENKGDVLIYGKLGIGADPLLTVGGMLQEGEKFRSGRYYLSANEPGKITANPSGPLIYIGSFHSSVTTTGEFSSDAFACINPQFMDIGTSHVHRAYPLVARPAGDIDTDGTTVVGYLPSSHSSESKQYPSLIFGGTWTSTSDVRYTFNLVDSQTWGTVKLQWYKNGDSGNYKIVDIPAPGVFVNLDNGLKVKVLFPEATKSKAYTSSLTEGERTWNLTFPWAGKGWVNHSVDAVASVVSDQSDSSSSDESSSDSIAPEMHVLLSGSWPVQDNFVYCSFPARLQSVAFNSVQNMTTVTIDGSTYQFVAQGESVTPGNIKVDKAATVNETLYNLAKVVNISAKDAVVLVRRNTLFVREATLTGATTTRTGGSFDVIGGTIPLMVVYSADYTVFDDAIVNKSTYTPISLDDLKVTVYAKGATAASNYTCEPGTLLYAEAYDYAPSAIYDYVMGLHQSVDYYFPPVPAQSAGLFVNGVEMENAAMFPSNPTYVIGRKTLHWMEDDLEHLPWPAGITGHDPVLDPSDDKNMAFYFNVGFQCATGPVTSLVPAPGAPIKLYTYGTNEPAYTGDLMVDAAFDFSVVDSNVQGYNVAKQGRGGKLLAGPVVEKINAGPGIIVTKAAGCPDGQGTLTISADNGAMRDHFNEVALENAKQEKLGLFPYISLLGWGASANIPSAFTMMMRVPTSLDPDKGYRLQLRMVMFGTSSYSTPVKRVAGIQMEYNILPDYTGDVHSSLKTGLIAPGSPRQISVPLGHRDENQNWTYVAYDPFVATTDIDVPKTDDVCVPFSNQPLPSSEELPNVVLKPGYLVAIRISRSAPSGVGGNSEYEAYTNPLGFLSMDWSLEEA